MGKKRKAGSGAQVSQRPQAHEYQIDETFDDSEDEFYAHRDKILLDEAPTAKRRRKLEEQDVELQPSDEEVFEDGDPTDPEDDDDVELNRSIDAASEDETDIGREQSEEDEDGRFWGTSRKDYYNTDVIETEADALEEEAETRRLQQKQLKGMTEADFGFDESEWAAAEKAEDPGRPIVEKLPPIHIPPNATQDERLAILRARYPEFEPLAEDLVTLSPRLAELQIETDKRRSHDLNPANVEQSLLLAKFRALSAYLAAIAMYMAVLTSTADGQALPPAELRDHPIMASLLRCRQLWNAMKELGEPEVTIKEHVPAQQKTVSIVLEPNTASQSKSNNEKHTSRQIGEQLSAMAPSKPAKHQPKADAEGTNLLLQPSKRRKEKKQRRLDIQDILAQATIGAPVEEPSDFGDETPLTREEAAEKARKRKSLRFYTSQIAQKANKRGVASRGAGGDDDVPYKERLKDKQARLMREAEQRVNQLSTEGDDGEDVDDSALVDAINGNSDDYYNEITSKSQQRKAEKKARAEAYAEAARQGAQLYEEEQIGPDGKRKITYAIAKNKGLTPKRKKEVRNPRVKKKKRYEQKMKKLSSIRPVYKGGEGKGGYGGELTGIKTNVVKSVKL